MCGLAALFGSGKDFSCIEEMTDLVRHRGPDDRGIKIFDAAALGHRRLSILDLTEHGHQPMPSEDGRFHIVYNGEIYNYLELKQDLEKRGYHFFSHSDTEVLLAAYQEWGADCLHRLNGMFAFVVYDSLKKAFFAARDRFGIKPLYYWISPSGLIAFASEIKQFAALREWRPQLNHQLAYDFLNWGVHDHTGGTLFSGVSQLRGGEFIQGAAGDSRLYPKQWYALKSQVLDLSSRDIVDTFRELLTDSVKLRLRADVAVGSCLSGGLDSSSIVCLAADLLRSQMAAEKQQTFSACSRVERYDERKFIEAVSEKTGHRTHVTYPEIDGLSEDLDSIVRHQDEPFGSTSIFAQWEVFKMAKREQTKVLLDGQGADEQLGGYTPCYGFHFNNLFRSLRWLKLAQEMKLSAPTLGAILPYKMLGEKLLPELVKQPLRKVYRKSSTKSDWLNFHCLAADDAVPFLHDRKMDLKGYCLSMIKDVNLPMLLHYEDRNSMAFSVEARTPFLDYRLVEFALSLPSEWLIDEGTTKRALRAAMKGVVPEKILQRRDKIGFATAEEVWIHDPRFQELLEQAVEQSRGIIRPSTLEEFERVKQGKAPFSFQFWRIVSFGKWMDLLDVKI